MLYRSTLILSCLGTLQISAVNDNDMRQKAATTACIQMSKPDFLTQLPTSRPATPKTPKQPFFENQKINSLRRVQTDGDFLTSKTAQQKKVYLEKIKLFTHFLQQLTQELTQELFQEQKQLTQEEERRAEEKRVSDAWKASVKEAKASQENYRVTHASTYFPHSGTVCETNNSETLYAEYHVPAYHMDF